MRSEFVDLADAWVDKDKSVVAIEGKIIGADIIPQKFLGFFVGV